MKNIIKDLRKQNNMTQEELAKACGVSRQTIYKWEADICLPNLNKIEKLFKVLNVSIDKLLL